MNHVYLLVVFFSYKNNLENGYEPANNGNSCETKFIIMMNAIGGINTLISVGIVLGVIIIYLIVLLFQKLTEKDIFVKKK